MYFLPAFIVPVKLQQLKLLSGNRSYQKYICCHMGRVSRKSVFQTWSKCAFRLFFACAKYHPGLCSPSIHHPGLCSPVIHSVLFNAVAQTHQGLCCPYMLEDTFSYIVVHINTFIDLKGHFCKVTSEFIYYNSHSTHDTLTEPRKTHFRIQLSKETETYNRYQTYMKRYQ